jgi:vitamin B12 transporter
MIRKIQVITLLISFFLPIGSALAQDHLLPEDSLLLPVVNVQHTKDLGTQEASTSPMSGMTSFDLGQFLDRMGMATILSNGAPGSTASIRNRGLASDHTMLNWNGVPINSVSLGTCDLSLIPVFFIDKIDVVSFRTLQGSANSNLGDVVHLNSFKSEADTFYARLNAAMNTLNNSFLGLDVGFPLWKNERTNDGVLTSRSRFFYQDFRNEFEYRDQFLFEQPMLKQRHNDGVNRGFLQEFRWHNLNSDLHVHFWWQEKKNELPAIMGSLADGSAEQRDEVLRAIVNYKYYFRKLKISTNHSWMEEYLNYRDKQDAHLNWLLDSRIRSQVWYSNVSVDWRLSKSFSWNTSADLFIPKVINTNYTNGSVLIKYLQFNSAFQWNKKNHQVRLDGRYDSRAITYKPNLFLEYQINLHRGKHAWNGVVNVARLFRFPDMNEMYWVPGGNHNLLPEDALTANAAINWEFHINQFWSTQMGIKRFKKQVENWIQWIPGSSGFWSPVNFKQVRISGFDLPVSVQFVKRKFEFKVDALWRKTDARFVNHSTWNRSEAKTLVYTPLNSFHGGLNVGYRKMHLNLRHNFYGERYTDENNTSYRLLDSYHLFYAEMGYVISLKNLEVMPSFSIDNLFDISYQSIRSYAMPGRVFQFNIQFKFQKSK